MRKLLIIAALSAALGVSGAELRLSGVLGQSQPPEAAPIPCVAMRGAAFDKAGRLCSFQEDGRKLLRFIPNGDGWLLEKSFDASASLGPGCLQADAERLVYPGGDGAVHAFDPEKGAFSKLFALPKDTISFQLAPSPFGKGWRCLALAANCALARSLDKDAAWTKLFEVEAAPLKTKPEAIGIEPSSGDILIGRYWPDLSVCRYSVEGRQVLNASWPRAHTGTKTLALMDGMAWSLCQAPTPIPQSIAQLPTVKKIDASWTSWTNGIARESSGRVWLSCSQGVVGFDKRGKALGIRVGGVSGPSLLASSPDGALIAYDAGRMLKLMADDTPNAPLACNPEEPFRAGANWKSNAIAMQFDGRKFIVLDSRLKRLWAFDPWHTGWKEDTWLPLTEENAFAKPESLAIGNGSIFVSDGGEILVRKHPGEGPFSKLGIQAKGPIAANKANSLFLASGNKITACATSADGSVNELWSKDIDASSVSAIAAGDSIIAAIDPLVGRVSVISAKDGSPLASISALEIPGGMEPCSVCAMEPWVFVGDKAGKRILRFRLR